MSADPDFLPYLSAHEVLLQEVTGLGYSLTGVLGVPRIKGLEDRQAIYEAYNAVIEATLVDGASAAIAAIDRDLKTNDVILDDNARVVVTFYLKGEVVEPQEMPLAAFGRWFAAMTDAGIIDVRPVVPPSSLAAYGKGVTADYEAAVWDARGAALLLLPHGGPSSVLSRHARPRDRGYETPSPQCRGSRTRIPISRDPRQMGQPSRRRGYQVLHAEAIEPATVGDPVGWWWVAEAEPFVPIAQGLLPPPEGPSRSERMKSAITAGVSQEAYFLTRPNTPAHGNDSPRSTRTALPAGRAWSPAALRERKRRRVNLERKTYTLDEYLALSLDDLLILNLTEYGRVGWQHEISTGTTTKRFVTRYRGGSQQIRFADPTGDIAVGLYPRRCRSQRPRSDGLRLGCRSTARSPGVMRFEEFRPSWLGHGNFQPNGPRQPVRSSWTGFSMWGSPSARRSSFSTTRLAGPRPRSPRCSRSHGPPSRLT